MRYVDQTLDIRFTNGHDGCMLNEFNVLADQ